MIAVVTTAGLIGAGGPLLPSRAEAVTTPGKFAARPASPGAESIGDALFPATGNGGYDALHYDIRLTYHASTKSITARTALSARATKRLSRFSLDFEKLHVTKITVDGRRASYRRHGTKLVITPQHAVSGHFSTVISYHGTPVTHIDPDGAKDGWIPTADGATVLSEPVGAQTWFPNNNTPQDKATYRVAVTAPAALAVAGNGDLAGRKRHGATTTWTWSQRKQQASYLAMISIGKYHVYHATMKTTTGRTLPIWNFIDPKLGSLKQQRDRIPSIIRFHERNYGPYPFTSAGIVVKKTGAGYALETQNRPTFDGLTNSTGDVLTEVHEFAHQWYGDSVSPKRWVDIWLNEGFADYSERLWTAAHGGPSTQAQFEQTYRENTASSKLWKPAPARFTDPADLFGDPVYTRGGMTLQALRHKIGDKAFFTILKRWAAQHRYGNATTPEFIRLSEKVSHQNLDAFFRTWLYVAEKPVGY